VFAKNVPATCGKCHGDAKYMEGRERPTDIIEKYRNSVHGRALLEKGNLSAPACNSCHGSHGAEKPRADSVANVCGKCHEEQAELFRKTKKRVAFDAGGSPECVVCHARHATRPTNDEMLGLGPESLCAECHSAAEDVGRKDAQRLAAAFSAVGARIESTDSYLAAGLRDGVDVREEVTRLDGARSRIARARVLVHGFDTQRILDEVYAANRIAESVRTDGETRVWRTKTRRWLVYAGVGAGVLLCLGLFLALWTRVREADSTWQRGRERQRASNEA
jgi:predicted CXXCH cytochrome family protein